jgi:hypothetical protein
VRALRGGELLAGAGAIGLLAALFLDWSAGRDGWSALGWLMVVLLVLAALAALWLVTATARRRVTQSVTAGVVATPVAALVFLVLLVRVLVLGDLELGAWLGLLFTALIPAGAWWSMADERTGAAESAYVPPVPRAVPPGPGA